MNRIPQKLHDAFVLSELRALIHRHAADVRIPMKDVICIDFGGVKVFPNGAPAPEGKPVQTPAPTPAQKGSRP